MAWWVLEETGSAAPKGTVLVFSTVPMLIFLLFGSQFSFFFMKYRMIRVPIFVWPFIKQWLCKLSNDTDVVPCTLGREDFHDPP